MKMKTIKRTLALSIAALFAALWLIPVCASAKGGAPAHVWWDGSNASWSVPEDDEPADHYEVYVYKNNAAVYSCAVYELSLDCTDTFKACGTGSYTFSGNVYSDFKSSDAYEYKAGHEHDLVEVPKKDAACTEDGEKKHYECPICGFKAWDKEGLQEITDDSEFVIPAKGHDWGEWKVTKEATTTSEGEKSRVCKNDSSHKETEVIPKKKEESHTEDTTAPTDPPKTTEKPTETTKPTGVVTTPSDNTAPSAAGSSSESKDSSLLRMILIIGGIIRKIPEIPNRATGSATRSIPTSIIPNRLLPTAIIRTEEARTATIPTDTTRTATIRTAITRMDIIRTDIIRTDIIRTAMIPTVTTKTAITRTATIRTVTIRTVTIQTE